MCGIVGAVAQRDIAEILVEGLRRLEYRGYDSAGLAVISNNQIARVRRVGKVSELQKALDEEPVDGSSGIAHTRWATHGEPTESNAHPHFSNERIAVVHNGIIENYENLRSELKSQGYVFASDTDTEVMAHLIERERQSSDSLLDAVLKATKLLEGAYGTVVMELDSPDKLVVARSGSPLVVGKGIGEMFIASDQLALLPVTRQFMFLEEGEVAEISRRSVKILAPSGEEVKREFEESSVQHDAGDKGQFRHFMMKEIFEQPSSISSTLEGRLANDSVIVESFGNKAPELLANAEAVQVVACGTSYHAAMVAKYWIESMVGIPCQVEIASEYRYRKTVAVPNSLFISISQSGETADTLAALRIAKEQGFMASLAICNVPGSSLVRESDMAFMTRAGAEIGVASTKAFTTQLTGLLMLATAMSQTRQTMTEAEIASIVEQLRQLPAEINEALTMDQLIEQVAEEFTEKDHCLFLGRGEQYPIAMEGALKLKEISYIHAEAYAAGELKHGPLALIDQDMPVVVVAPNNELIEKLKSNMEEVRARGGQLYVFADEACEISENSGIKLIHCSAKGSYIAPIIFTVPLQLLSYHVAVIRGTDVDQPRNLAKSVTVE
ncbi:glutamine--fructose-6-phosphate transaminase (isomerizing) [Aliikangiella coralliicola]|uniref:Glutamine--fructose-6-phosphate aminotransferase [isomerizing] n=1 Tax=Aliikangiella coralliicola TaxID=2592383 RepID=A0A545UGN0_9GAMM|nr:glutamine--fructose-6-phosphate transaminase (isomerizing) [Aliikangiella coralliicola]TQV88620.1 glutamine--fructose-6-phosphate transaminase (isomerizing) [Aliikangiella coralliicola]